MSDTESEEDIRIQYIKKLKEGGYWIYKESYLGIRERKILL